jgi:flagellar biosynthesis/type III secretory pathway protein FliH
MMDNMDNKAAPSSSGAWFIPREALGHVEAWVPECLVPCTEPALIAQTQAQTQTQTPMNEVRDSMALLLAQFRQGLDGVEHDLARRLAGIALQVARQVVRHELQTRATLVVDVVQEALAEVLLSARHITVKVHPQDHALLVSSGGVAAENRGVRWVTDAQIERGGCLVESDLGTVDARLDTRWARAVAAMGDDGETTTPWAC